MTDVGSQIVPIPSEGVRDEDGNFLEMTALACGTELLRGASCTFGTVLGGIGPHRLRGFSRMAGINGGRAQCQLFTVEGNVIVATDRRWKCDRTSPKKRALPLGSALVRVTGSTHPYGEG